MSDESPPQWIQIKGNGGLITHHRSLFTKENKTMPKVSIIIPTYNRLPFLKKAIDSVLQQTVSDVEIIVVDDGSTDGTTQYIIQYPFIHYIYQENQGVSVARNRGLERAGGEYICFLDSDDTWKKTKLEKQLQAFENNPDLKACYTDEVWIKNGKHFNQHKKHRKYSGWIFEKALPLCIISPSSIMVKRDIFDEIGTFDEVLWACEDYDLWLRLTARYPVHFIEEPLIIKTGGHVDQLSRRYWGMDRFRTYALEKILQTNLEPQQRKAVIKEMRYKYDVLKQGAWKRKNMFFWLECQVKEKRAMLLGQLRR